MSVPTAIIIVLGEAHLRRILKSYARYYNETRTHLALDKDAPLSRTVKRAGRIFFAAQSSADRITNISGFDFRQAQGAPGWCRRVAVPAPPSITTTPLGTWE